ncbi:MAG: hypothetical protein IPM82_20990 [Saprospiraceae bacterium]|nr:hypothetical protein [Saprospiraceae bacterium]
MKCGIIDSNYNIVVPAKYRTLLMSDDYYAMGTDCSLMSPGNCSKMVAIINMFGDTILYDSFNLTTQFLGSNALMTSKKVKEWYWYNEKGSLVLPFAINWPNWVYRENAIAEVLPIKALNSNEIYLYDKIGKMLTNEAFTSATLIEDSPFIWVEETKGKFGILNIEGKWIVQSELGWPYSTFSNKNLSKDESEYLTGFIGTQGNYTVIYDKTGHKKFEEEGRYLFPYKRISVVEKKIQVVKSTKSNGNRVPFHDPSTSLLQHPKHLLKPLSSQYGSGTV